MYVIVLSRSCLILLCLSSECPKLPEHSAAALTQHQLSLINSLPEMPYDDGRYYTHLEIEQKMQNLGVNEEFDNKLEASPGEYFQQHHDVDQLAMSNMNESFFKVETPKRSRLAARFDVSVFGERE